jgi:hypothetical protein
MSKVDDGVVRTRAGGRTIALPRAAGPDEAIELGIEGATQIVTPFVLGADGLGSDLRRLARLERLRIPIGTARARAEKLARTDEHRELRSLIAKALMESANLTFDAPIATPEELYEILR